MGNYYSFQEADVGLALETVPMPCEFSLEPVGQRYQSTLLTCMIEPAGTVTVVPNAKHWLDYWWITVMPSIMEMKTWG